MVKNPVGRPKSKNAKINREGLNIKQRPKIVTHLQLQVVKGEFIISFN